MSNFDKAVEVALRVEHDVLTAASYASPPYPQDYVEALDEAGLLAPDLPEPYRPGIFKVASPYFDVRSVQVAEDQIVLHGYKTRHASVSEARRLALALLAACECAEKEQDNG